MTVAAPCPGSCGATPNYDAVPTYSNARQRSGKFCPSCGHPLDMETHEKDTVDRAGDSKAIMEARAARIAEYQAASNPAPVTETGSKTKSAEKVSA